MKLFLLAFAIVLSCQSTVANAKVTKLEVEIRQINAMRSTHFPQRADDIHWMKGYFDVKWHNNWQYFFWDNEIALYGSEIKVEYIWWDLDLGLHLTDNIDFLYHHKSEHWADRLSPWLDAYPKMTFPVEDSYGFRINLLDI